MNRQVKKMLDDVNDNVDGLERKRVDIDIKDPRIGLLVDLMEHLSKRNAPDAISLLIVTAALMGATTGARPDSMMNSFQNILTAIYNAKDGK